MIIKLFIYKRAVFIFQNKLPIHPKKVEKKYNKPKPKSKRKKILLVPNQYRN